MIGKNALAYLVGVAFCFLDFMIWLFVLFAVLQATHRIGILCRRPILVDFRLQRFAHHRQLAIDLFAAIHSVDVQSVILLNF